MRSKLYLAKCFNQPKLLSVQINVTNKCHCKCNMCNKYSWPQVELTKEQFSNRLEQYNSIDSIVLSGGEPLMYKYLPLVSEIKPALGMFTCGIGQYSTDIDLLKKFTWIRISLDGMADIHNTIRGVNIWNRAVGFAKSIRKITDVRFQYTIQKCNLGDFINTVRYCVNTLHIDCFGFLVQGTGDLSADDKKVLLSNLYGATKDLELVQHSNILELIEQLLSIPYCSKQCYISQYHRIIDSDNTEWPCCYVLADNLPFEKRDLKYECSQNIHDDILNKKTPFCNTCDRIFSRYQRINEEYEQLNSALSRPIFL